MTDWASFNWDVARAGGVVAYVLVTISVLLGLILSGGWRGVEWPRFVTKGVHEHVTLAALVFTAVHGVAVWIDPYLKAGLTDILVPGSIAYRPFWVALGIVAGYLMLALWLSERIRPFVGYRTWRAFHFSAFAAYVLATAHGLASGTDATTWWSFAMYATSISGVLVLLLGRLVVTSGSTAARAGFSAAAAALVVGGGAWALSGPLQPGWGLSAGSRASLTAAAATPSPAPAPSSGRVAAVRAFQSGFTGTEQLNGGTLVITGNLSDQPGAHLEIDLQGRVRGGSFSVSSGRMTYSSGAGTYGGDIGSIDDGRLAATVSDEAGHRLNLVFTLGTMGNGSVSGTVTGRPV